MSKVVVISGHPNISESHTNTLILDKINKAIDDINIRYLDALYPAYKIDIVAEQKALTEANVVVLQFPFYWYSVPALLKKWLDDVFSYGFAYGNDGNKLQNKHLVLSFTVGGPEESYDPLGYNHFTISQLIQPLQQTAYLAGMTFEDPIFSYGMVYIPNVYNTLQDVESKAHRHAHRLIERIKVLANTEVSTTQAA